jgi:DNA-binding MarR family transcriptional regulator
MLCGARPVIGDVVSTRPAREEPTPAPAGAGTDLVQFAALLTQVVSAGVDLAIESAASVGLTLTQFRALAIVEKLQPARLTALATHLGVAPSSATQTCDRLVRAGWVFRTRDPADQRVVQLAPTEAGVELVAEVRAVRERQAREVLARLERTLGANALVALSALADAVGMPAPDHTMFGWS